MNLILASKSPRRKELLAKCGVSFTCVPADIDETMDDTKDLKQEIQTLAYKKARAVLEEYPDALVIGSDTIVVVDGNVFGKPKDTNEAKRMLQSLQGRSHKVMTGLCFLSKKKQYLNVSSAEVTFAPMDEKEIDVYVNTGECNDKAGAYGIQGFGGRYITKIVGDYYTIMGLPLNLVYEELKNRSEY